MRFKNREQAARQLADRLASLRGEDVLVVAFPPTTVPMARLIADALDADLDVALVEDLVASADSSTVIGAVDETGNVWRGRHYDDATAADLRDQVRGQIDAMRAQRRIYTHLHPPASPESRTVVVVDDGGADAMKLLAAIRSNRTRGARRIFVAIPVAPRSTVELLRRETDDVVVLHVCDESSSAAAFFDDFGEPTPQQVTAALHCRRRWSKAA